MFWHAKQNAFLGVHWLKVQVTRSHSQSEICKCIIEDNSGCVVRHVRLCAANHVVDAAQICRQQSAEDQACNTR